MTIASEGGHWYAQAGIPAYEVLGKKGRMRPTTLRDAKKLNLSPSVSGVMSVMSAEPLTQWRIKRALEMGDKLPRADHETIEDWVARVHRASREENAKAPDLGSAIHACIEKHLTGGTYDKAFANHVAGALDCLGSWCGLNGIAAEKSFCHPLGYGGKCDIHKMAGYVCDFKSKEFDEGKLPEVYDNHAMQLAAYREGFGLHTARCAIIYVSTSVPGLTHLVELPQDELRHGWELFKALLRVWQIKNRYIPTFETLAEAT